MKILSLKMAISFFALIVFFPFPQARAQDNLPPIDESQFSDERASEPVPDTRPDLGPEPDLGAEPETNYSADGKTSITEAAIEGIQISSEPGDKPEEKVVTCYFIFRDKPSSYFYEVSLKEKKIVFEFNDTKAGQAPITSSAEPPIKGFVINSKKFNINKDIKGLQPEYHNQVKVTFTVDAVPEIRVSDEYNIISFSYLWTTNPEKLSSYIVKDNSKKVVILSSSGVGVAGIAGYVYWKLTQPPKSGSGADLKSDDLPTRPNQVP